MVPIASVIGGPGVGVIPRDFALDPREDSGVFDDCDGGTGGVRTEDVGVPIGFDYAIPLLAGWELAYPCDDEHVTEAGAWLHDIEYDKDADQEVGTLRYKVSSVLRDKNNQPGHLFRYTVDLLGLSRR